MAFWIGLAWCAAAVAVAGLHHRLQRRRNVLPPEAAAFVLRLENELQAAHPGVDFLGLLPGQFACLLDVDGQETPVSLHEPFRHAEAFPDGFSRMVARLVGDIREVGLDHVEDLEFAAVATLLLPQVRSREWVSERGTFGDSGLACTPINDELATVYVIDDRTSMIFVCREHLRRWGKTVADVHGLALGNLARLGGAGIPQSPETAVLVQSGDGFDAARLLLLEPAEGLLVAVPDRDTFWVGPPGGQRIEDLMAATEAIAEHAAHPVSKHVFRVKDGRLESVTPTR
jgi:hypothetical protein